VNSLHSLYENCKGLQNRIRSVTYLISGAIFRLSQSSLGGVSQGICSLGELLDKYHLHEATKRHDKVYALLGMSSDEPGRARLVPNYQEPWEDILRRLVGFVVSDKLSVEAQPNEEAVILRGKGCVLGTISSVESNTSWDNRQSLNVSWRNMLAQSEHARDISARWTIQDSAKSIYKGDLVCHLEGAETLMIIRLGQDFSAAIVIAAQFPRSMQNVGGFLERSGVPTREFTVVWDWARFLERLRNPEKLEDWLRLTSSNWRQKNEKQGTEVHLEEAGRYWNYGLVLGDLMKYQAAEDLFQKAMASFEMALHRTDCNSIMSEQVYIAMTDLMLFKEEPKRYLWHSHNGWTPLFYAMMEEHKELFNHLLRTGKADVNSRDRNGQTLIMWAAARGYTEVVAQLIQNGADVNAAAAVYDGRTALQAAAEGGYLDVVVRLLEEKADVNAVAGRHNGRTALQAAAGGGHLAVVERLLKEKADVNAAAADSRRTALQAAAGGGHLAVVERLLKEKADVNAAAAVYNGRTALQAAAGGGHLAVVERLLEEKADVNAAAGRDNGRTALQAAAEGGYLAVVERLLEEKADVNAAAGMGYGRTALQAAAGGGQLAVVERLLKEKADVNAAAAVYYGRTALQAAAEGGHLAVVERLLEEKADVNAAAGRDNGRTALQAAAKGGHVAIAECLRRRGAVDPEDY
jgi:ankyrin repeat protein